jgi:hypothetical protein
VCVCVCLNERVFAVVGRPVDCDARVHEDLLARDTPIWLASRVEVSCLDSRDPQPSHFSVSAIFLRVTNADAYRFQQERRQRIRPPMSPRFDRQLHSPDVFVAAPPLVAADDDLINYARGDRTDGSGKAESGRKNVFLDSLDVRTTRHSLAAAEDEALRRSPRASPAADERRTSRSVLRRHTFDVHDEFASLRRPLSVATTAPTVRQEAVHRAEFESTGLLEDALIVSLVYVERVFGALRAALAFVADVLQRYSERLRRVVSREQTQPTVSETATSPNGAALTSRSAESDEARAHSRGIVSRDVMRFATAADMRMLIAHAGYPYKRYRVSTADGYVLTLERLPRRSSRRVVFLLHGIFDSSYAWIAAGARRSLAFRAYERGFDVFLGNLRGSQWSRGHTSAHVDASDYWDFSLDDHGRRRECRRASHCFCRV